MTTRSRRAVVPAVALALALTGCSATNTITTQADYAASDGVRAELGDLRLGNLLVLTSAEGEVGTLIGSVTNDGSQDAAVDITVGESTTALAVDARSTVVLGSQDGEQVEIESVPAPPGAFVAVTVTSDVGGTMTVRVPVLDGTLPEYADLVP